MSSNRGRKRNDNLPPNRARDIQRAFRARRAAHLQALEQRVAELEDENDCFRQALNLPPSDRPHLGKGPTGRDKPRSFEASSMAASIDQHLSFSPQSRESPTIDSHGSRASSPSPHIINVSMSSMSSRPMQVINSSSSWSGESMLGDSRQQDISGSTSAPYQLAPMLAGPLPLKSPEPAYTSSSLPSSSSLSYVSGSIYIPSNPFYSHSSDRPLSQSYHGPSLNLQSTQMRDNSPRHHSYTPLPFHTYDYTSIHSQSPSSGVSMNLEPQQQTPQHYEDSPGSHPQIQHRRCVTDPHGSLVGQNLPAVSRPSQVHTSQQPVTRHPFRHTELTRSHNVTGNLASSSSRSYSYTTGGHLNLP